MPALTGSFVRRPPAACCSPATVRCRENQATLPDARQSQGSPNVTTHTRTLRPNAFPCRCPFPAASARPAADPAFSSLQPAECRRSPGVAVRAPAGAGNAVNVLGTANRATSNRADEVTVRFWRITRNASEFSRIWRQGSRVSTQVDGPPPFFSTSAASVPGIGNAPDAGTV